MGTIPAVVVDGFERVAELDKRLSEIADDLGAARAMRDERVVAFKLQEEAMVTADLLNYVHMFVNEVLEGHYGPLEQQPPQPTGDECESCDGWGRIGDDIECNECRGSGSQAVAA